MRPNSSRFLTLLGQGLRRGALGQPYRMMAARGFIDCVGEDIKTRVREKANVLGLIEATVVQRLAPVFSNDLAVAWPAREHQRSIRTGVVAKNWKHISLIFGSQMEETVPCK